MMRRAARPNTRQPVTTVAMMVAVVAVAMMSPLGATPGHAQDTAGRATTAGTVQLNRPQGAPVTGRSMPLTTAVLSASRAHADLLVQAPPDRSQPKAGCGKRAALGTAIGAGVGAATAAGLLAATRGSDSTFKILFNITGVGAVGGLVIGSAGCHS